VSITINDALKADLLDAIDTTFNSGTLEIRSGSAPGANNAATGTVLATITLPADAFVATSAGVKASQGTWQDASADATGTAAHFRLKNVAGTRILEGTVGLSGADLNVSNTSLVAGQGFTVTSFPLSFNN